ncbi:DUF6641 family protein [Polynucleobacter sp. MG-6-Vaara-E2]|uniref:DUF6641 family protein n=1 Tax=Polynucleobacter sp. MG-6-Vaara-E2 TaxID=2576932 RepID=UPI001BFDADF3|nr:DUF6641 family protein [Polynucleobacter sp. MG-6-Vaara-E2]QWD96254.1 hypothetical protein ICV38_08305 [Polynucleobacter sp. MG-6-Vaara-E2]
MSTLNSLKLVAVIKPAKLPPVVQRRNKLSDKIWEQIQLAEAKSNGGTYAPLKSKRLKDLEGNIKLLEVPKRIKPWWFTAPNGKVCLILRYGSKVLEIAQGKSAIELDKPAELIPTLQKIKTAVEAGELDHLINAATEAVRMGFKH